MNLGQVIGLFSVLLAIGLVVWTWREASLAADLAVEDRVIGRRQVIWRVAGGLLLGFVGVLILVGSGINPRAGREDARRFVTIWSVALLLVFGLMILAAFDLWATGRARRRLAARLRETHSRNMAAALSSQVARSEGEQKSP